MALQTLPFLYCGGIVKNYWYSSLELSSDTQMKYLFVFGFSELFCSVLLLPANEVCEGGLCLGGLWSGGSLSRGVSVQVVFAQGGLCPRGSVLVGLCPGGPPERHLPHTIKSRRYASYWNVFLFHLILYLFVLN